MKRGLITAILLFAFHGTAFSSPWNLPQKLSSKNAEVTFEVDSTWHLVHGTAKQIDGELWLADVKDFRSINGRITLPVAAFDTDNESRDEKLRRVMHSDVNPNVTFEFSSGEPSLCDPHSLESTKSCVFKLAGDVTINGITKKIVFDSQVTVSEGSYKITGLTKLNWPDYGVEDPSIFVAKLDEEVTIRFLVLYPKGFFT